MVCEGFLLYTMYLWWRKFCFGGTGFPQTRTYITTWFDSLFWEHRVTQGWPLGGSRAFDPPGLQGFFHTMKQKHESQDQQHCHAKIIFVWLMFHQFLWNFQNECSFSSGFLEKNMKIFCQTQKKIFGEVTGIHVITLLLHTFFRQNTKGRLDKNWSFSFRIKLGTPGHILWSCSKTPFVFLSWQTFSLRGTFSTGLQKKPLHSCVNTFLHKWKAIPMSCGDYENQNL